MLIIWSPGRRSQFSLFSHHGILCVEPVVPMCNFNANIYRMYTVWPKLECRCDQNSIVNLDFYFFTYKAHLQKLIFCQMTVCQNLQWQKFLISKHNTLQNMKQRFLTLFDILPGSSRFFRVLPGGCVVMSWNLCGYVFGAVWFFQVLPGSSGSG